MVLEHSAADQRIVEAQLGRHTRGAWAVARRCHLGVPMVIESAPRLEDGSPFPTLYWLTCPILVRRISHLEAAGELTSLTQRLAKEPGLQERLTRAIERYRARRDAHEVITESGGPPGGGPERVKCLHSHAAHELASPQNPIGSLALAEVGWPDCIRPCVELEKK